MSLYNMLNGVNPLAFLAFAILGADSVQIPRFRDVHWVRNEDDSQITEIAILTRMGGGNAECWEFDEDPCECPSCFGIPYLESLPGFKGSEDEEFDSTYRSFNYTISDDISNLLANLPEGTTTYGEVILALIDEFHKINESQIAGRLQTFLDGLRENENAESTEG